MVTNTFNIRKSAYHALKAKKRVGKSFSEVILRFAGGDEKSVSDFFADN